MALVTFSSPNINLKVAGTYPVFTSLLTPFVITGITCVAVDVTGPASGAYVSIGSNSPNFDSFVFSLGSSVTANNKYQYFSMGGTVNNLIPPLSNIQIKVATPDTGATTNVQRIDITGYYL